MPAIEMEMSEVSAAELAGHYRAARARLWGARPKPKQEPELPPLPILSPPKAEIRPPPPPAPLWLVALFTEDMWPAKPKRRFTAASVHEIVAEHFGVAMEDLLGKSHLPRHCRPRQIAAYICVCHCGMSLSHVGRATRHDHSSIWHARNKVEARIACNPAFAAEVAALVALCKPHE